MTVRTGASVEVRGLSHSYTGARPALSDVSFTIEPGLCVGLLGPNGAGKSTLMRLLCGYLPLTAAGRLRVDGFDVAVASHEVRARVGYMPEHVPLYPELRVAEHLRFRASIKRVPRQRRRAEVERVCAAVGLSDRHEQPIGQLSRGYRQRVGIADALLGSPPLLVLDEPTVGLDPNQVLEVRSMLQALGGAHTLLFSSHILAEVEVLCDRVVVLSRGTVVADESMDEALRAGRVCAELFATPAVARRVVAEAWRAVAAGEPAVEVETRGEGVVALVVILGPGSSPRPEALLDALGRRCAEASVVVRTLAAGQTRLEQRFAAVTGALRAP